MTEAAIPYGQPADYQVKVVEEKKRGKGKNDRPYVIWKLGLVHGDQKLWAEMFCGGDDKPPQPNSTETLILKQSDNPDWLPGASRPRRGGGGGRGISPRDRARIERQHSQEMSLRFVGIMVALDAEKAWNTVEENGGLWSLVERYTDRFHDDLDNAKASQ